MGGIEVRDIYKPAPGGDQNRIASTLVGGVWWVSTVDLTSFDPIGYACETMVFPCDATGEVISWEESYCDRYHTREGAEDGHAEAVRLFVERCERDGNA